MEKIRTINPEQIASFLRTVLQVLGGYLVAQGYLGDLDWTALSGAVLVIVPTLWGLWARKDSNLIKSAAEVPAVTRIVAPGTSAARDGDYPKVTST